MKDSGTDYILEWNRLFNMHPRKANRKICNLCCLEALVIMKKDNLSINERKELASRCPHRRRFLMSSISDKDIPPDDA